MRTSLNKSELLETGNDPGRMLGEDEIVFRLNPTPMGGEEEVEVNEVVVLVVVEENVEIGLTAKLGFSWCRK